MKSKKTDLRNKNKSKKKYKKKNNKSKRKKPSILLGGSQTSMGKSARKQKKILPYIFNESVQRYKSEIDKLKALYNEDDIHKIIQYRETDYLTFLIDGSEWLSGFISHIKITDNLNIQTKQFEGFTILSEITIGPNVILPKGCFKNSKINKINFINRRSEITFDEECFMGCKINVLEIPAHVNLTLLDRCFANCKNLVNVNLGNSLSVLGNECFSGCEYLRNVTLHENLNELPEYLFRDCKRLEEIKVDFSKMKRIGTFCFSGCRALKIPKLKLDNVTVGDYAFYGCGLERVEIKNIETIPKGLFKSCWDLTTVKIYDNTVNIEFEAFSSCINLKAISIPHSVIKIKELALFFCFRIPFLILPENLTSLPPALFYASECNLIYQEKNEISRKSYRRKYCANTKQYKNEIKCIFISKNTVLLNEDDSYKYNDNTANPFSELGDIDEFGLKIIFYGVFENFKQVMKIANYTCLKKCHKIFEWYHDDCIVRGVFPAEVINDDGTTQPTQMNPRYLRFIDKIRFHTISGDTFEHQLKRKTLEQEKDECQKKIDSYMDKSIYHKDASIYQYHKEFDYSKDYEFHNIPDEKIDKILETVISKSKDNFFENHKKKKKSSLSSLLSLRSKKKNIYLSYYGYNHVTDPPREHLESFVLSWCIEGKKIGQNGTIKLINDDADQKKFFTIRRDVTA